MRTLLFISLLIFMLGCSSTKNTGSKSFPLNGTWVPIKQEMGGRILPNNSFEKQLLLISDSAYIFTAESEDKGVIRYADSKMDIYGKVGVNTGKHFTVLYKYENEQLTICYNLNGKSYPETFETKGQPLYFLSVYKKGP